jgi:hypothetical protein
MCTHRLAKTICDHFWFGLGKGIASIPMTRLVPFLDPDFISLLAEILLYPTAVNPTRTASTLEVLM